MAARGSLESLLRRPEDDRPLPMRFLSNDEPASPSSPTGSTGSFHLPPPVPSASPTYSFPPLPSISAYQHPPAPDSRPLAWPAHLPTLPPIRFPSRIAPVPSPMYGTRQSTERSSLDAGTHDDDWHSHLHSAYPSYPKPARFAVVPIGAAPTANSRRPSQSFSSARTARRSPPSSSSSPPPSTVPARHQPESDPDDAPSGVKKRKRRRKLTEEPRDIAMRKYRCDLCSKAFARSHIPRFDPILAPSPSAAEALPSLPISADTSVFTFVRTRIMNKTDESDLEASSSSPLLQEKLKGLSPPRYADDTDDDGDVLPTSIPTSPPRPRRAFSRKTYAAIAGACVLVPCVLLLWWVDPVEVGRGIVGSGKKDSKHWPTNVGFEGPTPTGSEAFAAATSYPKNHDHYPLNPPSSLTTPKDSKFNILEKWANLSPWRSVSHGLGVDPRIPSGCEIEQVHLLHRQATFVYFLRGNFAKKLADASGWKATGALSFLNDWTYQLGAEILTPFGREQLFALGAGFRVKYGKLLQRGKKPVFRTESQDRMLKSALNFAGGFFGIPYEDQYHQLITVEWPGFNNTLSPYMTCKNAGRRDLSKGNEKVAEWLSIYLTPAQSRIQAQMSGLDLTLRDIYNLQMLCAYEVVALGGSEFCELFTASSIRWIWHSAFGQPAQAALGLGWVQEWLARVTKMELTEFNSTTNASYHTPEYFPLDQNIYVDATHDTIISAVITTLNFTGFAAGGALPSTHIPPDRSFDASRIAPFAANLQAQILSCSSTSDVDPLAGKSVRWILNDGVVPLDGVEGCGSSSDGLCDLATFVDSIRRRTSSIDWAYDCLAPYDYGDEPILNGRPARVR
ncbi:phytase [Pseudohyphozyma bogoriensis]|nr:phytase [Pseudohyphozyma bogoriensis]